MKYDSLHFNVIFCCVIYLLVPCGYSEEPFCIQKKKQGLKKQSNHFWVSWKKGERDNIHFVEGKKVSQASLAKPLSLDRVQVTRALQKLEDKNIIIKSKNGKTNSIELVSGIKILFD